LDFIFFAGVTGSLFCNVWAHNPKWDYVEDITGCGGASERDAAVEAAFRALGYRCEIVGEDKLKSDIAHYKRRVVDSLDKGLPVLTYGIVGYPCCSLITGYDDNGDVLIGWSKFQDDSAADDLPDGFEPCGYFRKRNGLSNSHGLIFFGEKSSVPDLRDDYKRALLNIVNTADLEKNDKLLFGADAYSAWADALECDADFPIDDINTLVSRLDSHSGPFLIVLTGRLYASEFLSRAAELVPEWRTAISEAISLYNEERDTLFGILGIQGGFSNSDREIALKLAAPAVRRQIAGIIRTARDLDNKAVECFRRCL
jgi:hypothetical protein